MINPETINRSATLGASPLLHALRCVCDEVERSDANHAALLIAVGRRLIAHPAGVMLLGELAWYRELRRFGRLAALNTAPIPFDSADTIDRLLHLALAGRSIDAIEACKVSARPLPPLPRLGGGGDA